MSPEPAARPGVSPPYLVAALLGVVLLAAVAFWAGTLVAQDDTPSNSSATAGFLRDMTLHHDQAVEMAELLRDRTTDEELAILAADIALTQQAQIGRMEGWLDLWGLPATGDRPPLAWTDRIETGQMEGMADQAQVDRLATAPVDEAEALFLTLMIDHHRGGVDMAEAALDHDLPEPVERLARGIVAAQQAEIDLLAELLEERQGA